MKIIIITLILAFSIPLSGQKWERLTIQFNEHYEHYQYAKALADALKALEYSEKKLDSTDIRFMLSYYNVALAYHGLEELGEAKINIWTAYNLMVVNLSYDANLAEVCELYGRIETELGFHETAASLLSYARDIKLQVYGKESYDYMRSLYFMADLEMARARWEKMVSVLEEALDIHERFFRKNQDFARYANYLGLIYMNNGHNQEAALNFERALSAYSDPGVVKNFTFGHASNNLALAYYYESDFENASIHFERADSIYQLLLEGYSENYMMLLNNLASLYYSWDKTDLAREAYHQLEEYLELYPDPHDLNYVQAIENTAGYYAEAGELETSEKYYKKAIALRRSDTAVDNDELAGCIFLLASLYAEESRPDLAAEVAIEAYNILVKERAPGDPDLVWALSFLGQSYYDSDQNNRSLYYYQLAKEQIELAEGQPSPEAPSVYNNLGMLYYKQNRLSEAVPCMEKAHQLDPEDPVTMINLGLFYFEMENLPVARDMFNEAKEIYGREYGMDHPDYANALIHGITSKAMFGDYSDEMLEEIREVERICLNSKVDSTGRLFIDCIRSYRTYYYGGNHGCPTPLN